MTYSGLYRSFSRLLCLRFLLLASLLLAACAVGPEYTRPTMPVSDSFKEMPDKLALQQEQTQGPEKDLARAELPQQKQQSEQQQSGCDKGTLAISDPQTKCMGIAWKLAQPQDAITRSRWWEAYADPQLNQLMEQFVAANQNIIALEAQYRQAQALVQQAQSSFFPTVGVSAGAMRAQPAVKNNTQSNSGVGQSYNVQLQASWEADIWGKIRRNTQASAATAQASAANVEAARLSARAALARTYFQLRILDLQKRSAEKTVAVYTRALTITKNRYASGMAARGDIAAVEVQRGDAQVALLDLEVQRSQSEHALAVLVGADPSRFQVEPVADWQVVFPGVPPLLPTQLLERRPDIASAERNVAAASAKIGVAKAAYFPSLTLSAVGGYESSSIASLLSLPNQFWSLGPALALTLFDGGARTAQVSQAQAAYEQAVAQYRQIVLSSIQEVEDNLVALRILDKELSVQTSVASAARQTAEFAMKRYQSGSTDYLSAVSLLSAVENNERSVLTILGRRFLAHASLMAALGGGSE